MKRVTYFFIKIIAVMVLLSQTTTSDTGYQLIGNPIEEPLSLTLCGLGLLILGLFKNTGNQA